MHDFCFHRDQVAHTAYIANTATVLGDVTIGDWASVWWGAVVRGNTERIRIGRETNIQDLALLHADPGYPCVLGDRVTVGHQACVHGAQIGSDVLIGIRAVVLNGCVVGSGSIVAAGALLPEGMQVAPYSVVMGSPGKVIRLTEERDAERIANAAKNYVAAVRQLLGISE